MNMNGWDTCFVASIDVLNQSLNRNTSHLLQSFSFSQDTFSASGNFGTWSIQPGGSGNLLMLQILITSGKMVMTTGATPIDISGMQAVLLVNLKMVPSGTNPSAQTLVFDFSKVGTTSDGPGVVTPHDILNSGSLTVVQKAALGNAIANCLVQNASTISFVFATINPTQASVSWLQPAQSKYAYLAPAGVPSSLAILSATSGRDISNLPLLVDPAILQGAGNAGLAVSSSLFLQNVMAPALLQSLKASGTLTVNSAGVLVNSGSLSLPKIDKASESYYPRIDSFSVAISDTQMNVSMNGSCDMHMGVHMTFNASSSLGVSLTSDSKSLHISTIGTPTFHKDVDIPWYDHLFDIFGGIAEIILQVCVAAISSELGSGISDVTSAQAMAQDAPKIVTWANTGGFQTESASLATSLCIRGQLS